MQVIIDRQAIRRRIRHRIRRTVRGTARRPRIAVFRSVKHIYVQAIDDELGRTVAHASTLDPEVRAATPKSWNREAAKRVGGVIAERLKAAGVGEVVFDRGGYVYHGRVRALAEAVRESGIKV
jgi:large subunit ribosomal protein L18